MNNNMSFNIDEQSAKLTKIINNETFIYIPGLTQNESYNITKKNFLVQVLKLTMKYPQVELYLKDLLNYFTTNELEEVYYCYGSILHCMASSPHKISLGAFEIIINHGININIKNNSEYCTSTHILLRNDCNKHINSILDLLIKYGVDLSITNKYGSTVLDTLALYRNELNEETQNCVMTLIDFGTITNKSERNNKIYDFIESYKSSSIKPAIKNENII